ncbi:MAG: T9SS type A sorting domain-containing protein [bacterium]|nr:T9SS type A sorting domain-containing protein [bacterium]
MKKLLLSIAVIASGFAVKAQVICAGVSPLAIQGNYEFSWAEPGTDWSTPDFLVPGTSVIDTLMMADDGTPGTNPQGNPMSAEACNPIPAGQLDGKIAVIYRNTCEFGTKALNAENAGAVAVIIINREDEVIQMGGGADGASVTIPVVFISSVSGAQLVAEMQNGPVVMFLGNKFGAFADDIGANNGEMLVAPYGGANSRQFDGFTPGIQLYNFGTNDQASVDVTATIDGPNGNYYTETVNIQNMLSSDTASIFPGNPLEFPAWTEGGVGMYDNGLYTLTYTMDFGGTDESDFDNTLSSTFSIQDDVLSLSNVDVNSEPVANTYPSNSTTEYQSCMMVQEDNASTMATNGVWIVPHVDTAAGEVLAGAEIFVNAYQWDDGWVDLDDPNYTFDPTTNDAFQNLNLLSFGTHYPASDNEVEQPVFVPFQTQFQLQDGVRYLFCIQTFESATVAFGYDNGINYDGNQGIFRQPPSPVHVDGEWYAAGWAGVSAPSLALNIFDPAELGLEENTLGGTAFPNPAEDKVKVTLNAEGDAVLTVADVTGKVAFTAPITLVNGSTTVDISSLATGVYTFNVALESGATSTFNVVKK